MKKLILTFAFFCAFTMVNAQQINYMKLVNGQWVQQSIDAGVQCTTPQGVMSGQQYAAIWNAKYQSTQQAVQTQQDPFVLQSNLNTLEMQKAQIDNLNTDTKQKKTQTILNVVSTGVNVFTALRTDARNEKILNATLYGSNNRTIGYQENYNGGYNPSYSTYYSNCSSNNAWSANCQTYVPVMPQTYGGCGRRR